MMRRSRLVVACAMSALSLILTAVPGIARVLGDDDRERVTPDLPPWTAQCKVVVRFPKDPPGKVRNSSGTLISPRHVLTAGHCLHDPERGGWAEWVRVIPALDGEDQPSGVYEGRCIRVTDRWTSERNPDWDLGLVTLAESVKPPATYLPMVALSSLSGVVAHIAGYPGDCDYGTGLYRSVGPIEEVTDNQVMYRIDDAPGTSGAGVLTRGGDGQFRIVAIASWGSEALNGGCRLTAEKLRKLDEWMAEDAPTAVRSVADD